MGVRICLTIDRCTLASKNSAVANPGINLKSQETAAAVEHEVQETGMG
jgi:hypothetical protein